MTTRREIRRLLGEAYRQTARVGDQIYYPADWSYPDADDGCTTSQYIGPMTFRRTAQEARREIAIEHVMDELGVEVETRQYDQVYDLGAAAVVIAAAVGRLPG